MVAVSLFYNRGIWNNYTKVYKLIHDFEAYIHIFSIKEMSCFLLIPLAMTRTVGNPKLASRIKSQAKLLYRSTDHKIIRQISLPGFLQRSQTAPKAPVAIQILLLKHDELLLRNIAHSKVLLKFILRPDKYEEDLPVILTINQPSDIHNRKDAPILLNDTVFHIIFPVAAFRH